VACVSLAIAGKFGACWAAARFRGESQSVALRVGALMNARGLMQLIAINVGLAAGIVTKELFSVLVVVALVTTVMATPMLGFWDRRDRARTPAEPAVEEPGVPSSPRPS
jgi:Kef-type K+ transport system membrane component KefB